MGSVTKYLFIGLFALYALQQSEAQPSQVVPNCQGLPDGYKLPGKNPANFYFCQGGQPIAMFCPPGFNFCYNGLFGVCSKWCTNVTPEPTTAAPGCETTTGHPATDIGTQSISTTIGSTTIGSVTTTTTLASSTIKSTETTAVSTNVPTTNTTPTPTSPTTNTTPTPTSPTTVPTTTAIAGSTTPAPPNPETVCSKFGVGSIFSIKDDCSAFGVCIFGKVVIGRCLGNRLFDPVRGICTGAKCTN